MKNRHCYLLYISLIGMFLSLSSCEKDDICPESAPGTPDATMKFYSIIDGRETETPCDGIEFYGLDGNTRLKSISPRGDKLSILLPLDFESDESSFLLCKTISTTDPATNLTTTTELTDTIHVQYNPELSFVSKACGYRFVFDDVTVTGTYHQIINEIIPVIEDIPADGYLQSNAQTCAKIYLKKL